MKKFKVLLSCVSHSFVEIEVEAENRKEAKKKALNIADNSELDRSEYDAEYDVEKVDELPVK